jgi:hypothetical protein
MSDELGDESGRLSACRSCGNRVARDVRRCPACGVREPTSAPPAPEPTRAAAAPAAPSPRVPAGAVFAGGVLTGMAVSAALFVLVLRPVVSPPVIRVEPTPAGPAAPAPAPIPEPASAVSTPPVSPPAPGPKAAAPPLASRAEPSRSRGRADWLFFFKPGDQLVRMGDDTAIGMVIRTVPRHAFADGTVGPAYVLQLPDGAGQLIVDADELERGGRLQ